MFLGMIDTKLFGETYLNAFRELIREEIEKAQGGGEDGGGERLLTAEEAAGVLSVSPDWLYRNASRLPFTRKLGPKMLRFSTQGIQKWLATRKLS